MTTPEMIYNEAMQAANDAALAEIERLTRLYPSTHYDHHVACGFAWVTVTPARGPFVAWCKKQKGRAFGSRGDAGGWQFWSPGYNGQCLSTTELCAEAFANVLRRHGLEARSDSRLVNRN